MTTKQRNFLVLGVIVGALSIASPIERQVEQAIRQNPPTKPSPFGAVSMRAGISGPPSAFEVSAPQGNLPGLWKGTAALEDRGICDLYFEIVQDQPPHFTAYSNFSCTNAEPLMAPKHRANLRSEISHTEAAHELRCSRTYLDLILTGRVPTLPPLPVFNIGCRVLIRRSMLRAWIRMLEARERENYYGSGPYRLSDDELKFIVGG